MTARLLEILDASASPDFLNSLVLSNIDSDEKIYGSAIAFQPGSYNFTRHDISTGPPDSTGAYVGDSLVYAPGRIMREPNQTIYNGQRLSIYSPYAFRGSRWREEVKSGVYKAKSMDLARTSPCFALTVSMCVRARHQAGRCVSARARASFSLWACIITSASLPSQATHSVLSACLVCVRACRHVRLLGDVAARGRRRVVRCATQALDRSRRQGPQGARRILGTCVRACVLACVCVRSCVRACMPACLSACLPASARKNAYAPLSCWFPFFAAP